MYTYIQKIFKKDYFNYILNTKILKKIFTDVDKDLPNLHRWCNTTSNRYKNICNWEKKLDNAQNDNCYTSYINNK